MSENYIKEFLTNFFGFLKTDPNISVEPLKENTYNIKIEGDDLSFLIGRRGTSLEALQLFLGMANYRKTGEWAVISLDINGYRDQKSEKLQNLTRRYIDKLRFFGKEIELPPMSAWERKQIHTFISEYEDVVSESTGTGRDRRIVLKSKR